MSTLLFILCQLFNFACIILLLIGLIKPSVGLFWLKGERTRSKCFTVYIIAVFASSMICGAVLQMFPPEWVKKAPKPATDTLLAPAVSAAPAPVENALVEKPKKVESEPAPVESLAAPERESPTPSIRNPNGRTGGCYYHGRELYVGRKGGCYYYNSAGEKEYVDRYYCRNCD